MDSDLKSLVVKSNDLILSRYNLSLSEQRLILKVVSMINKDDEDFKDYYVKVSDYVNLIESKSKSCYSQIKKFTEELLKKPLFIPQEDGFLACNWFSSIKYIENKGELICCFDPKLKPYLLKLKSCFTAYRLENVLKLKNKYSIRLYEILKRYENMRENKVTLDNFKKYLSIPNTYLYGDIKKQILKPAQKEFEEHTDIMFDFEEIKESRKVVALSFKIYKNKNHSIDTDSKNNNQLPNDTPQTPPKYEHEQYIQNQNAQLSQNNNSNNNISETMQNLLLLVPEDARTINLKNYLEKALEHYDEKYIRSQIEYVNHQKKVSNYKAYLAKAIEEDYADIEKIKLEEKAQIIKNKYRPQIDRIMSMNTKQTPLYKSKTGESYYLSSIQFSENELIIYHDIKNDDELGPYSAAPHIIPLDDERTIASNLKQIEEILSSKKEKSQETETQN